MNALPAIVEGIKSHNQMSVVSLKLSDETVVSTIILETPETLPYLKINNPLKILFKETEVILSKNKIEGSTLNNTLKGTIKKFNCGELLARVEIEVDNSVVSSLITKSSFDKLDMKVGDAVFLNINSSEIMLSE